MEDIEHSPSSPSLENFVGCSDMIHLPALTEESIQQNLRIRFEHDQIYVSFFFFEIYYY